MLSLPCPFLWKHRFSPPPPEDFLRVLRGEVAFLAGLGAGLVEFPGEVVVVDRAYASPGLWSEVAGVLGSWGLGATAHLPFAWVDLTSLDGPVWEGSLRSVETALAAMRPLDLRMAAVHPANYSAQAALGVSSEEVRPTLMASLAGRLCEALRRLKRASGSAPLALENLEGVPYGLLVSVSAEVGIKVCLDVGHSLAAGEDPARQVLELGDHLAGLHLHDARPPGASRARNEERAHLALGEGALDLDALVRALLARRFNGPVVLEIIGEFESSARAFAEALARGAAGGGDREC